MGYFAKKSMNRNITKIGKFLFISLLVYVGISFGLIFWPITLEKNTENYDYSGIEKPVNPELGEELWVETENNYKFSIEAISPLVMT